MSYYETVSYLYNLQKHGIKFGLENISRLMSALDNPHESFLSIHVAGTNGKGSTSAIISSILRTAGFRVGLFTSPHLVSFTERIRINGEEITEDDVIMLAENVRDVASRFDDFTPTFFEVVTAMAFLYFRRKKTDIAVIETGMGGRLDATNVIKPEISVITSISYDHREFLGTALKEIAHEKAGIIKKGIPVVTSSQEPEVIDVIEKEAEKKNAQLYIYGNEFSSILKSEDISGICFDYRNTISPKMQDLGLPLSGEHQMQNASVAIKAASIALKNIAQYPNLPISLSLSQEKDIYKIIRDGIAAVRWPGRLECINEDPPVIIDAAHNPAAAVALAKSLKKYFLEKRKKIIIILGIMADKDVKGVMEPLLPLASEIILTAPSYSRAASPEKLAEIAESLGYNNIQTASTVKDAIEMAIKDSCNSAFSIQHSTLIIVTGSFYTIGEAREALGQKGVLAKLREC